MLAVCRHCGTSIVDYSSVVDVLGELFCCRNCLVARRGGHIALVPDLPTCQHCACALFEPATLVERQSQRFCCYNCAVADTQARRPLAA